MLVLPKVGMAKSAAPEHKIRIDAFCDWIEASLAFDTEEFIAGSDIVDILKEEELYEDQEFAWALVDIAWTELKRRQAAMGTACAYAIEGQRIVRRKRWDQAPAYSFFLTLGCAEWYPDWAAAYKNYEVQGELFELVTVASLKKLLPLWTIHRTGWSPKNKTTIHKIVSEVADMLMETKGEVEPWESKEAKEAGLDIVCFRPFNDRRPNLPTMLVQCASGKRYHHKLGTPDLKVWSKLIRFIVFPTRWFATPLAMTEPEFKNICNRVDGLLLDRFRLLSAGADGSDWLGPKLSKQLNSWIKKKTKKLERAGPG